jgi:hypothetical protein
MSFIRQHAGVGGPLVLERDHLVQRPCSVANLTESLPQNVGKTLPLEAVRTNHTVRVDIVVRWLLHLYKNRDYILDLESSIT